MRFLRSRRSTHTSPGSARRPLRERQGAPRAPELQASRHRVDGSGGGSSDGDGTGASRTSAPPAGPCEKGSSQPVRTGGREACNLPRRRRPIVGWASPIGHRQLARGTRAGRLQFADGDSNVLLCYAPCEAVLRPEGTGWQQRPHCTPPRVWTPTTGGDLWSATRWTCTTPCSPCSPCLP